MPKKKGYKAPGKSKQMKELWADPDKRQKLEEAILEGYKEKKKYQDIDAHQTKHGCRDSEGYREYMREYQRMYRKKKSYYYAWLRKKRLGQTDKSYEEWLAKYLEEKTNAGK